MTMSKTSGRWILSLGSAALILALAAPIAHSGSRQAIEEGREEFLNNCAVCHGTKADGRGPMVPALKEAVPDLRRIAERNDGTYPYDRIGEFIDGRAQLLSHGSRDMPVWGSKFNEEGNSSAARPRILNLVLYLQSIQVK